MADSGYVRVAALVCGVASFCDYLKTLCVMESSVASLCVCNEQREVEAARQSLSLKLSLETSSIRVPETAIHLANAVLLLNISLIC